MRHLVPLPAFIVGRGDAPERAAALVAAVHRQQCARALVIAGLAGVPLTFPADGGTQVVVRSAGRICPCCAAEVPFRVALVRWIREVRPDAIFMEVPAGWHLEAFVAMLERPPFDALVTLREVRDLDQRFVRRPISR